MWEKINVSKGPASPRMGETVKALLMAYWRHA